MWPMVRQYVPDAELHVFYGWESFDRTIQQTGDRTMIVFKQQVLEMLKQEGVTYRGRVSQPDLAKEMRTATVLTYPTQFLEVSCITAMESMAAGCVVLSTIAGALPETVGTGGLLVRGFPTSDAYQNIFTKDIIALMKDEKARSTWSQRGMNRAEAFPWKGVAQEWLKRIG
jgi:glycosyltransferase involved in cell wall biosynthesis